MDFNHPPLEMRLTAYEAVEVIDELITEKKRARQKAKDMRQRAENRIPSNIVPDLTLPKARLDDETYPRSMIYDNGTDTDGDTTMHGADSGTNTMGQLHELYDAGRAGVQDRSSPLAVPSRPPYLVGRALKPDGSIKDLLLLAHQREGVGFAESLYESGKPGFFLADERGLGKTMQAICLIAETATNQGFPSLVLVPNELLGIKWKAEIEQSVHIRGRAPKVLLYHGDGKKGQHEETLEAYDIIIAMTTQAGIESATSKHFAPQDLFSIHDFWSKVWH